MIDQVQVIQQQAVISRASYSNVSKPEKNHSDGAVDMVKPPVTLSLFPCVYMPACLSLKNLWGPQTACSAPSYLVLRNYVSA